VNHSLYSADRATYLKIVVLALIAGIFVAGLGTAVRLSSVDGNVQAGRIVKAGALKAMTSVSDNLTR
jgi:hypothetical protein